MESKPVTPLTAGFRPTPSFAQVPITANTPSLPQKIDLNSADPMYHDIYNEYNSTLDQLNSRLANAQQQAQTGQQAVQKGYDVTTGNLENQYNVGLDTIRSANQDAQLKNRLAARAKGGAPSSGFLDLSNRTDLQSQKDIAQAGRGLQQGYQEADLTAQKALAAIQASLGDIVAQIQGDATLSLRQKNDQINQARSRAAQLAASNVDWNSILGGTQDGGQVLGASTSADGSLDITTPNSDYVPTNLQAAPKTGFRGTGWNGGSALSGLQNAFSGLGGGGGRSGGF